MLISIARDLTLDSELGEKYLRLNLDLLFKNFRLDLDLEKLAFEDPWRHAPALMKRSGELPHAASITNPPSLSL